MRNIILIALLIISQIANSQYLTDFETIDLSDDGFFNGESLHSGEPGFETFTYSQDERAVFSVSCLPFNNISHYWVGTATSNQTDLVTESMSNFSAYINGSKSVENKYGISYMNLTDTIKLRHYVCGPTPHMIAGSFCNSTWTYKYIQNNYEAEDYYKIILKGLNAGFQYTGDVVEFYLADFTNGNNLIVDNWMQVDLTPLASVWAIEFSFETTKTDTPPEYCIDNLSYEYRNPSSDINEQVSQEISIYPNPAKENIFINISEKENFKVEIYSIEGKYISESKNSNKISIQNLAEGIYFARIISENKTYVKKFIKK